MLIKKGIPLKDPNRESNMKHTTPNEIMAETRKRKQRRYKTSQNKSFTNYPPGEFERIFGVKTINHK